MPHFIPPIRKTGGVSTSDWFPWDWFHWGWSWFAADPVPNAPVGGPCFRSAMSARWSWPFRSWPTFVMSLASAASVWPLSDGTTVPAPDDAARGSDRPASEPPTAGITR